MKIFYNLFEEKADLKFELTIEIPFIERFKIANNKKILSMINSILHDRYINYNCLNLFQNSLKEIKFSENNPNNFEKIKLKSSIDFNLSGIGIPKIPEKKKNSIEIKIKRKFIIRRNNKI